MNQIKRRLRFQQLHTADAIFLMPNAWDAGSALMLASCGFPAVARVRAARRAADVSGVPFVLTARSDVYLTGASNAFAEAVERCNAYREAGADCLFVPGASDPKTIEELVREINGPLTVVMGLTGSSLTVSQLGALGVRPVTVGGSLARATFGLIRRAAQEMVTCGTFSYADQQIPDAELSQFFADQRGSGFTM